MSKILLRRYLLFCVSLFVNALGIAFITKAALGTSPITSVTYVLSMFTPFTIGQWTIMLNLLFVVVEPFLMTRKDLKSDLRMYLLQIPISFCFGMFIDLCMHCILYWLNPVEYLHMIVALLIGCVILAVGIALEVRCGSVTMPGEGFPVAISKVTGIEFPKVKIVVDVSLVLLGIVFCYIFFGKWQWHIIGVGTLFDMYYVGWAVRIDSNHLKWFDRLLMYRT